MHCRRDHSSTGATLVVPFTLKINAEPKNEDANDGECNCGLKKRHHNAAKARLAGPHVAPIDGKEHADKRNAAKVRLAGPHVAPIDGKEHADKGKAAKARLAGLKKP